MYTRMFKHDGGYVNALAHELADLKAQGWVEAPLVKKVPVVDQEEKPSTIEPQAEQKRRGRPRKEE